MRSLTNTRTYKQRIYTRKDRQSNLLKVAPCLKMPLYYLDYLLLSRFEDSGKIFTLSLYNNRG